MIQEFPLVTFVLFAYNQEKFIREAVEGALNQQYERLEIILSDDCSTDATFEIISTIAASYSGPHKVVINKNPVNLGLAKHFNKVVGISHGDIIVIAAGDDISLPTRVAKTVDVLCSDPEAVFVSFTDSVIDSDGVLQNGKSSEGENKITKITLDDYLGGSVPHPSAASRGYRKKIFDIFGDLNAQCPTEDTPSILRGLMVGHALISSGCEIFYRRHDANLSRPESLHSMAFDEIKEQYTKDADVACSVGLITLGKKKQIYGWAEKNYRRRVFFKNFHHAPSKMVFFLKKAMLSRDLGIREKVDMFRYIVNHR